MNEAYRNRHALEGVALTGRNTTDPPCAAPGELHCICAALQTTDDDDRRRQTPAIITRLAPSTMCRRASNNYRPRTHPESCVTYRELQKPRGLSSVNAQLTVSRVVLRCGVEFLAVLKLYWQ